MEFNSHIKHFWENSSRIRITLIPGKILVFIGNVKHRSNIAPVTADLH